MTENKNEQTFNIFEKVVGILVLIIPIGWIVAFIILCK